MRLLLREYFLVLIVLQQLLDYDAARSKMRKLIDKPSEDPTKLPKVVSKHFFLYLHALLTRLGIVSGSTRT